MTGRLTANAGKHGPQPQFWLAGARTAGLIYRTGVGATASTADSNAGSRTRQRGGTPLPRSSLDYEQNKPIPPTADTPPRSAVARTPLTKPQPESGKENRSTRRYFAARSSQDSATSRSAN